MMSATPSPRGRTGGTGALILDRRFLGLAMMEFWERFAIAGVKSLLVLVLVDQVFARGAAPAFGVTPLRALYEGWIGPTTPVALASQVYGYAGALLYLSVPLGGLIGDLVARRRRVVFAGAGLMLVGLLLMVQLRGFLPGLAVFMVAAGTVKGNLSVQLGQLYPDAAMRQRGYAAYLGFLNAGVICGPLVCGALAVLAGWGYAVGAAALAVAIGIAGYTVSGGHGVGASGPEKHLHSGARGMDLRTGAILVSAILSVYFCWAAYEQLGDIFLLWARGHIALSMAGWTMPVGWFVSLDGLFTVALIVALQVVMPWLARRGIVLGAAHSILLGGLFCAGGYGLLALASAQAGAAPLSIGWALGYILLVDIAVVLVWPSGLSLIAAVAPPRFVGWWTGVFYLHGFFASLWAGMSGGFYGHMPDTRFWLIQATVAGGGVLLALVAVMLGRPVAQATTTSA